ncbi:hypothetical protein CF335_g8460, partial [Tilletia laevis]
RLVAAEELPIRLAHRLLDLQALPFVAMSKHHLESVYRKWFSAFESLRRLPPICTIDDNDRFVKNSGGISEIISQ